MVAPQSRRVAAAPVFSLFLRLFGLPVCARACHSRAVSLHASKASCSQTRACASFGGSVGRPRCSRILRTTTPSLIHAINLRRPPQWGQSQASFAKTRRRSSAHVDLVAPSLQVVIELALDTTRQAAAKAGCAGASDERLEMRDQKALQHAALWLAAAPLWRTVVAW